MSTITIGVDLAKSVFSVCEVDGGGRVLRLRCMARESRRKSYQHDPGNKQRPLSCLPAY